MRAKQDEFIKEMEKLGFDKLDIAHLMRKGLQTMDRQEAVDQLSYLQHAEKGRLLAEQALIEKQKVLIAERKKVVVKELHMFNDIRDEFLYGPPVPLL